MRDKHKLLHFVHETLLSCNVNIHKIFMPRLILPFLTRKDFVTFVFQQTFYSFKKKIKWINLQIRVLFNHLLINLFTANIYHMTSSSSCADSIEFSDCFLPSVIIIHLLLVGSLDCIHSVHRADVSSNWMANTGSPMRRCLWENVA